MVTNFKKTASKINDDAEEAVKEDNVLRKIFANTKQGGRQRKKETETIKIIP